MTSTSIMKRDDSAPFLTMKPSQSARSIGVASLRSLKSQGSEHSIFEKSLPQDIEEMELAVAKGAKFGLSHDTSKGMERGIIYNVTVEPYGNRKTIVKEIMKHHAEKPLPDANKFNLGIPEIRFNDPVLDTIVDERHERSIFRKERRDKFSTYRYVPALATERLVPCWRQACPNAGKDQQSSFTVPFAHSKSTADAANDASLDSFSAAASADAAPSSFALSPAEQSRLRLHQAAEKMVNSAIGARQLEDTDEPRKKQKTKERKNRFNLPKMFFVTPTVSVAMKRSTKAPVTKRGWRTSGLLEVEETLHPHMRSFDNGGTGPMWEEVERQKIRDEQESKKQWIADAIIPGGVSEDYSDEVYEIREQSQGNLQKLRKQYEQKRNQHQTLAAKKKESGFDKYLRECKTKSKLEAARAAAHAAAALEKATINKFDLSLGMGKKRPEEKRNTVTIVAVSAQDGE